MNRDIDPGPKASPSSSSNYLTKPFKTASVGFSPSCDEEKPDVAFGADGSSWAVPNRKVDMMPDSFTEFRGTDTWPTNHLMLSLFDRSPKGKTRYRAQFSSTKHLTSVWCSFQTRGNWLETRRTKNLQPTEFYKNVAKHSLARQKQRITENKSPPMLGFVSLAFGPYQEDVVKEFVNAEAMMLCLDANGIPESITYYDNEHAIELTKLELNTITTDKAPRWIMRYDK